MKKVAIIGTAGVPARYGGFETLAHHLVEQLGDELELTVYCSKAHYAAHERPARFKQARLVFIPFNANGAQSIIYDLVSMLHAIWYADAMIVLGVSGGIAFPIIRLFTKIKLIVNIDGLEWRRNKWNYFIKKFLRFSERLAVKYSHADITDNRSIKKYTARYYGSLSYYIAYGADHVLQVGKTHLDIKKYPFLKHKYAFKVCRIEPENNVHVVLEAFRNSELPLVMVGNWKASSYGREMYGRYNDQPGYYLYDPIYEQRSLDLLRGNASVYIHGHSAGGTNPSLVEAMYLGLPVIAFDVSFNRHTTHQKALYFKNVEQLEKLMDKTSENALKQLGIDMKNIAEKEYTWEAISRQYADLIYAFSYGYRKSRLQPAVSRKTNEWLTANNLSHLKNTTKFYE